MRHAIQTGLISVRWILSRNIQTGEIKRFSSTLECSRYFNIGETVLLKRLNRGTAATTTRNWHVFMYEDQGPYWPELTKEQAIEDNWDFDFIKTKDSKAFKIKVTNLSNKRSIVYPSLNMAAKNTKVVNSTLSFYFKSYGDVVELNGYRLRS